MEYHSDRSNPSDAIDPDMTGGYPSVDDVENLGRM